MTPIDGCERPNRSGVATAVEPHPEGDKRLCSVHYSAFVTAGSIRQEDFTDAYTDNALDTAVADDEGDGDQVLGFYP